MLKDKDFAFSLDHVVIFSAANAPEAETLETMGLQGWGKVLKKREGLCQKL